MQHTHVQLTLEQVAKQLDISETLLSRISSYFEIPQDYHRAPANQPKLLLFGHDDIELIQVIKGRIISGQTLTQVKQWLQHHGPQRTPEGPISGMTPPTLSQQVVTPVHNSGAIASFQSMLQQTANPLSLPLPSQTQITPLPPVTPLEAGDASSTDALVSYDNSQQLQQQLAQATMAQYRIEHPTSTPFKALASKLKETGYMPEDDTAEPETVLGIRPASTNKFVRLRQALSHKNTATQPSKSESIKHNAAMSTPSPVGSYSEQRPSQQAIVGWPHQQDIPMHSWMSPEQRQRMIRLQQALMSPRHQPPPTA